MRRSGGRKTGLRVKKVRTPVSTRDGCLTTDDVTVLDLSSSFLESRLGNLHRLPESAAHSERIRALAVLCIERGDDRRGGRQVLAGREKILGIRVHVDEHRQGARYRASL